MFESRSGVFLIAGVGFFLLSFVVMGLLPWFIYRDQPEKTVDDLTAEGIIPEFVELAEKFPERFNRYFAQGVTADFRRCSEDRSSCLCR